MSWAQWGWVERGEGKIKVHGDIFIKQYDWINRKGGNQRDGMPSLIKGFKMQDGLGSEIKLNVNAFGGYSR